MIAALFMLDNGHEVWLWQGWWPELENDQAVVDQTGSGAVRWQAERKAAMQTVVNYCKQQSQRFKNISAYLVWAGLEPLAFTNLFPFWRDCDDVAELNIQVIPVKKKLNTHKVEHNLIWPFRTERKQGKLYR